MKLRSTWLVLAVLIAALSSRPAVAGPIFGFEGGLSMSGLSGDDALFRGTRYGPAAGGYTQLEFGSLLSVQPELLFATKGGTTTSSGVDAQGNPIGYFGTATLQVSAIEIPVLLRVTPQIGGSVRPSFAVGPAFSFEMSEQVRVGEPRSQTIDTNQLKNTDVGLTTGIALDFPRKSGFWRFDVRSNFGLTNIEEPAVGDNGIHNWNVVTMVGYGWRP